MTALDDLLEECGSSSRMNATLKISPDQEIQGFVMSHDLERDPADKSWNGVISFHVSADVAVEIDDAATKLVVTCQDREFLLKEALLCKAVGASNRHRHYHLTLLRE